VQAFAGMKWNLIKNFYEHSQLRNKKYRPEGFIPDDLFHTKFYPGLNLSSDNLYMA